MIKILRRKRKLNNKGFSLVELIVSFGILAVVALTVLMLMSAGTNIFTKVDADVNMQYKSQTAMAQFQEYFMSCSKAICNTDSNNVTYLADGEKVYAFRFDSTTQKVYFKDCTYQAGNAGSIQQQLQPSEITDLFCSDISAFRVDVIGSGTKATSAKITLSLADDNGRSYQSSQIFSFRATPTWVKEADEEVKDSGGQSSILYTMLNKLLDDGTTTNAEGGN